MAASQQPSGSGATGPGRTKRWTRHATAGRAGAAKPPATAGAASSAATGWPSEPAEQDYRKGREQMVTAGDLQIMQDGDNARRVTRISDGFVLGWVRKWYSRDTVNQTGVKMFRAEPA